MLLTDTSVVENAILVSTTANWEGKYTAVELLPTNGYCIFSTTPLDEPYLGPGVSLKIPRSLKMKSTKTPSSLPLLIPSERYRTLLLSLLTSQNNSYMKRILQGVNSPPA